MLAYTLIFLWLLAFTVAAVSARSAVSEGGRTRELDAWAGGAQTAGSARPPSLTASYVILMRRRAKVHKTAHNRAAIVRLIRAAWEPFGRMEQDRAVCVAYHESRFRPDAEYLGNVGIFEINYGAHHRPGETYAAFRAREIQPRVNVAHAFRIYEDARRRWGNGWLPWSTRGMCGA